MHTSINFDSSSWSGRDGTKQHDFPHRRFCSPLPRPAPPKAVLSAGTQLGQEPPPFEDDEDLDAGLTLGPLESSAGAGATFSGRIEQGAQCS